MAEITMTTDQGPSADNQTSEDRGMDTNQGARQPSTQEVLKAEGIDQEGQSESEDDGSEDTEVENEDGAESGETSELDETEGAETEDPDDEEDETLEEDDDEDDDDAENEDPDATESEL